AGARPPRECAPLEALLDRLFVAVLADPEARPDAAARLGAGRVVALDASGARRGELAFGALAESALRQLAARAAAPAPAPAPPRASRRSRPTRAGRRCSGRRTRSRASPAGAPPRSA